MVKMVVLQKNNKKKKEREWGIIEAYGSSTSISHVGDLGHVFESRTEYAVRVTIACPVGPMATTDEGQFDRPY